MRLRNVKGADEILKSSDFVVNDYKKACGKWRRVFNNENDIYIEIGMGKGDFLISEALMNPNINYIGIEKYESVLLRATQKVNEMDLNNIRFICMDALVIDEVFKKEVSKIYLNFSDPWPKNKHGSRRLTNPIFLNKFKKIVKDKLIIEMKTDNDNLFNYSINEFKKMNFKFDNIDRDYANNEKNLSKTEYEKKFIKQNKNINYLKVKL